MWREGGEEREVAVKSLADGSTEEKRIQFLQEAAIMGQFKHPSIITLHGVITASGPVYIFLLQCRLNDTICIFNWFFSHLCPFTQPQIVVEILVKGDLKRHLISLQPLYV